jgi:hypothetical protein
MIEQTIDELSARAQRIGFAIINGEGFSPKLDAGHHMLTQKTGDGIWDGMVMSLAEIAEELEEQEKGQRPERTPPRLPGCRHKQRRLNRGREKVS